jgi:hypothetical protein
LVSCLRVVVPLVAHLRVPVDRSGDIQASVECCASFGPKLNLPRGFGISRTDNVKGV